MMSKELILVINTGNSSTKAAVFSGNEELDCKNFKHSDSDLTRFASINDQVLWRRDIILNWLESNDYQLSDFSAVSCRGGLLRPVESGTWIVDHEMVTDLIEAKRGSHASHLAAQIGIAVAGEIPCFVVDPVSVDEYSPIARFSGYKGIQRRSLSHALNMKAIAKRYAKEENKAYEDVNLIIVHLGSGISVSLHQNGKMTDGINCLEEGPFSGDRSGELPLMQISAYLEEHDISISDFIRSTAKQGGFKSYLGTSDFYKISEDYKSGNEKVQQVVQAMAYQIGKTIGSIAAAGKGRVDMILFTGGMAYVDFFIQLIRQYVDFIAPVFVYPGEDEMLALAEGALRVLRKEESPKIYGSGKRR